MAKAPEYLNFPRQTEIIIMPDGSSRELQKLWVKSTQTKPKVGMAYPDCCLETDTGKYFFFNDDTQDWDQMN